MIHVLRLLLIAPLLWVLVLTNPAWRRRKIVRDLSAAVEGAERFVDAGIVLRVVEANPRGERLLEGKPPLKVLREHRFGGVIDTKLAVPALVGPSKTPTVWHCSRDQELALLHRDRAKPGQLIYGSEGAGKTRLLAMWHALRWLENIGESREGGQTAPTSTRLEFVREEMFQIFPRSWYHYQISKERFVMCDGTRIQLVSTYRQSKAQGSPIQGFNWSWCGRDEAQDQIDVHEDIESRGRSAKDGLYWQLATATAKDDSDWRTLRDRLIASGVWEKRQLSIFRSPFIAPGFLEAKKVSMSDREYRRRYGAEDLPPERAVYHAWDRKRNLIAIPDIGWEDVTASELARWGDRFTALVGHDPGSLFDVSLILKAYRTGPTRPFWVVVGEVTTEQTTTEQHVDKLLAVGREHWGLNLLDRHGRVSADGPRMLVRADPYGNNDSKPHQSCYTLFRQRGITIHPAAYSEGGTTPGRVPKNEGIELVNTLLCNARDDRRLFVALDRSGAPVAPNLVKALESSERDHHGKAETQRKDKHDLSHWPAALRYALWAIERPRLRAVV